MQQLLRFFIVGGINTALTYGLYCAFLYFGLHYQLALLCEYCCGIVFGYTLNRHWTFVSKDKAPASFFRYATTYFGVYVANVVLLSAVVEMHWMSPMFGQFVVLGIISLVNFAAQKYWVFRKKDDKAH